MFLLYHYYRVGGPPDVDCSRCRGQSMHTLLFKGIVLIPKKCAQSPEAVLMDLDLGPDRKIDAGK